jgi:hypothetical protein
MTGCCLNFKVQPIFFIVLLQIYQSMALADQPFKLGVEQKNYQEQESSYSYPAAQMATPTYQGKAIQSNSSSLSTQTIKKPSLKASVQTNIALPPAFLGTWIVQGKRTNVEALPEFQQGAQAAFALNNSQLWAINGDPVSGYKLASNTGVETQLIVDRVEGTTAFIRYQHPVGNTMAQEAIVMSLEPGGAQFNGLERIAIVKQGLNQPRAKVTYQLLGNRQR